MTNFYSTLATAFESRLDADFLRVPGRPPLTYRDVDIRSAHMAGALRSLGVAVGDSVVAQVDKSTDNVALYLACLRMGAIFLPLNTAYTESEVGFFVSDASPSVVVARPGTLGGLASAGDSTFSGTVVHLGTDGDGSFAAAAGASEPVFEAVVRDSTDVAVMVYTSGTTGRSKGAMLTHENLASNAHALHTIWEFGPADVLLHTLPIFHIHGLFVALHCAMLSGNEVIFLPKFDVAVAIAQLPYATVMMAVPTQHTRLLADERFTAEVCQSIRLFTSGSAPLTEAAHTDFTKRTGHQIVERYGMTEAGILTSNPYDGDRIAGTVGFPLPGVELRISNEAGLAMPAGETGVVEVRSPGLFAGYWQLPDKTADAYREDGWFITGDVGSLDATGRLTLEGRSSDMIISGGFNVYPKEVELVLDDIPGVLESAVDGEPHPDFGEAVVAIIVRDGSVAIRDDQLAAALDARLARFKQPKRFIDAEALPRNAMAKVQKAALRRDYAELFAM